MGVKNKMKQLKRFKLSSKRNNWKKRINPKKPLLKNHFWMEARSRMRPLRKSKNNFAKSRKSKRMKRRQK